MKSNRREFLKFIGASGINLTVLSNLQSCQKLFITNTFPSLKDDVVLLPGLKYEILISFGDPLNNSDVFGFNNDYINYHQIDPNELIMWVNHEYVNPLFATSWERSKENIDKEKSLVGGTIVKVKKINQSWKYIKNDPINKAIRANTKIPFAGGVEVAGSEVSEGTLANCAGGKTPWNTFLTCEENYDASYGERKANNKIKPSKLAWEKFYPNPPEHYGWVVEVDPLSGNAKKHINLGRFAHESATCITSKDNKVVVYSGDDHKFEHLYKFVSESSNNFEKGTLYAADLENNRWLPIDLKKSPVLKQHFSNHTDLMINTRKAAKILGASKLDRPEDIEIHPHTGDVYISLTNNEKRNNYYGQILKLSEKNKNHSSLEFTHESFVMGGEYSKLSCPDNLAFDLNGNLWVTNDMKGQHIGKAPYEKFGNNGLFVIPTVGERAGEVIQVASAPIDAEFTGPCFSPDYKTLFLSVQHPGETTKDINHPTSHWPTGKTPKPSVIAISGPELEKLTQRKLS